MPTMVAVNDSGMPPAGGAPPWRSMLSVMRRPIGSSFGKCSAAKRWLMIAALAARHAVFVGEVAAALQRQADGLEVMRIDRQHRDVRRLLSLIERLAVDRQAGAGSRPASARCW